MADSTDTTDMAIHFHIKDCALISIATGTGAQNLRELRDRMATVGAGSLFHHFWGGLLSARFEEREYNNDFASWAWHGLRDKKLAEKLAIIDPADFCSEEELRRELIEVIESHLDESDYVPWAKTDHQFEFIRSQIVVFHTKKYIESPECLPDIIPKLSASSVFFHFIDARRREPYGENDFSAWLAGFGEKYEGLRVSLNSVDPFFKPLTELRKQLAEITLAYFSKGA